MFSAYFFVRVLYIIFWPWGLLIFYDLGECKDVFRNLFFIEHKGQSFCRSYQLNLSKRFTTQRLCSSGEAAPVKHSWLKWTTLNSYFSKSLIITTFRIIFLCSLIGLPHLPKGSVPIRAFCVISFFMLFMIKVLRAVMCISMHLPSRLECQQRDLNWNTPFILDNLIGYHCPWDMLIKVLSWFCLERDQGRPSTHVTEIRE